MLTAETSNTWTYRQPVDIHFGSGILAYLGKAVEKIGGTRGLLVTSHSFRDLAQDLKNDPSNRIVVIYHGVRPNPELTFVEACDTLVRTHQLDFIIALGGGSVLDCAKATAAVSAGQYPIRHYFGTSHPLPDKGIPVIAIPTTAGTGSEVTSVSVLSDGERKLPLSADSLTAQIVLIDPELTRTASPRLTAVTGMDALCHAIEGFISVHHQPICDTLAVHAASLILNHLERAVACGDDRTARTALAEASVTAGLAFARTKTTGPHACSYPLTAQYGIPHGEACGLTLDWFIRVDADIPRVQNLANRLGFESPIALAQHIFQLKQAIHLRTDLKDFSLTEQQIHQLARDSQHPNLRNNPKTITEELLIQLYTELA